MHMNVPAAQISREPIRRDFILHPPLQGEGGERSEPGGVPLSARSELAARTPPRRPFGASTLPLQGRAKTARIDFRIPSSTSSKPMLRHPWSLRRGERRLPVCLPLRGAERPQALGAERRTRGPPRGRADLRRVRPEINRPMTLAGGPFGAPQRLLVSPG